MIQKNEKMKEKKIITKTKKEASKSLEKRKLFVC